MREVGDLAGWAAALATDAQRQDRRMEDQGIGCGTYCAVGYQDLPLGLFRPIDRSGAQPIDTARLGVSS